MEALIESDPQKLSDLTKQSEEQTVSRKTIRALELGKENELYLGDDEFVAKYTYLGSQLKRIFYFAHYLPSLAFLLWIEDSLVCVGSDKEDPVSKKFKIQLFWASEAKILCEINLDSKYFFFEFFKFFKNGVSFTCYFLLFLGLLT